MKKAVLLSGSGVGGEVAGVRTRLAGVMLRERTRAGRVLRSEGVER